MKHPTDEEIAGRLVDIISDGFNRSINALQDAGAIDATEMRRQYSGIGSKYYDLVTERVVATAERSTKTIRDMFTDDDEPTRGAGDDA